MKTFIRDVLDLMALNAKPIYYYQKYSIATSCLVVYILAVAFHVAMPVPAESAITGFSFAVVVNFLVFIIAVLFLYLWLRNRKPEVKFSSLLSLSALASVIGILEVPLGLLYANYQLAILMVLEIVLLLYSSAIIVSALSKSTNISIKFVLMGFFFCLLLVIFVTAIAHVVGVTTGVLLPPKKW